MIVFFVIPLMMCLKGVLRCILEVSFFFEIDDKLRLVPS